jgi:hypothetical protein
MLASVAGQERRTCRSSAPDKIAAIAAGDTILLANLTAEPQTVRTPKAEITLAPFGIAAL